MLSLSYQLLISVVLLNVIVYFLLSARAKKNQTPNKYGIGIFLATSIITVVLHSVIYLGLIFFQFNNNVSNKYSVHPIGINTYVMIKPTKLFKDKGAPAYIGDEIKDVSLKIGDTVTNTASYRQGDFVSGKEFLKIIYKGQACWFEEKGNVQTMFYYSYANQPMTFEAAYSDQNKLYWERAKIYMESYQSYNRDEDFDPLIFNDTVMSVSWQNTGSGGYLNVKRKSLGGKYLYEVKGGRARGQESCIRQDVKDRFGNSPANQHAFAYFIRHGNFYYDTYKMK